MLALGSQARRCPLRGSLGRAVAIRSESERNVFGFRAPGIIWDPRPHSAINKTRKPRSTRNQQHARVALRILHPRVLSDCDAVR